MAESVCHELRLLLTVEFRFYFRVAVDQKSVDRRAVTQYFPLAVCNHGYALARVHLSVSSRFVLALESVNHAKVYLHFSHLAHCK